MAKPATRGISEKQIREAIDQLQGEGESPSPAKIRRILGSGSYSTISKTLVAWREEQHSLSETQTPEMPNAVKRLTRQLWQTAFDSANANHDSARIGFEAERREWAQEKRELTDEVASLDNELENMRSVIEERDLSVQECQQLVMELRQQLAVSNGQVEKLEQQLAHFHDIRKSEQLTAQGLQTNPPKAA